MSRWFFGRNRATARAKREEIALFSQLNLRSRHGNMTRIVFLDRGTMGPALQLHRPSFRHDWVEYERTAPEQVVERLRDCDIAISNKVPIRRDSIEKLTRLKMIAIPATGHDAFDID